jgi:hypothetical protein
MSNLVSLQIMSARLLAIQSLPPGPSTRAAVMTERWLLPIQLIEAMYSGMALLRIGFPWPHRDATQEVRTTISQKEPSSHGTHRHRIVHEAQSSTMGFLPLPIHVTMSEIGKQPVRPRMKELSTLHPNERVFKVKRSPHVRVFPRCAAIVRHGGAGTTLSSFLAGGRSILAAHMADQFFGGDESKLLGVGGKTLTRKGLSMGKSAKSSSAISAASGESLLPHHSDHG